MNTFGENFSNVVCYRYMNGSGSNPDAHVVAYAGAQEKKGLEIAKKLNAENYGENVMTVTSLCVYK